MKMLLPVLLAVAVAAATAADLKVYSLLELEAHHHFKTLLRALSTGSRLVNPQRNNKNINLLGFSYTNCGNPKTDMMVPSKISLKPDPISIPGNLTFSGDLMTRENVSAPVKVVLEVKKEILGVWIPIPCISGFGSCTYDDVCKMVEPVKCPEALVKIGLGCHCPFKTGNWTIQDMAVSITQSLPVKISGGVKIHGVGTYKGQQVTCADVEFKLA